MLPKINRIKKKKEFEAIFRNSRSFKTNIFIFKAIENGLSINRFGFVVAKKISKKAVVRNRIKRRLAEAASLQLKNIKIGTDMIFIALPGIEKKDFKEIKEAVFNVFLKTRLLEALIEK